MRNLHNELQMLSSDYRDGEMQVNFIKQKIAPKIKREKFIRKLQSEILQTKGDPNSSS